MSLHLLLRSAAIMAAIVGSIAGCSDHPPGTGATGAGSTLTSTLPPDCPGVRPDARASSPLPVDDPNRGVLRDTGGTYPPAGPEVWAAIRAYGLDGGRREFVAVWDEYVRPGAPVVVAFTRDADRHRVALLATRVPEGPARGTPLGELGWPIEVVVRNDPVSLIRGRRSRAELFGQAGGAKLHLSVSSNVNEAGQLEIAVPGITDEGRRLLAEQLESDEICVRIGRVPAS